MAGSVKIQEKFCTDSLFDGRKTVEEKYDRHSLRRAWRYNTDIYFRDEKGVYCYSDNGRNAWFIIGACESLERRGYELSRKLKHLYKKQLQEKAEQEQQKAKYLADRQALAKTSGKPVVVSSSDYQTTASIGTNYAVAMPGGEVIGVTVGQPTGSHGDRFACTSDDPTVKEAIREYNRECLLS